MPLVQDGEYPQPSHKVDCHGLSHFTCGAVAPRGVISAPGPPALLGPSKGRPWHSCRLLSPPSSLNASPTSCGWDDTGNTVHGKGANWHELVTQAKPRGWRPSPQVPSVCGRTLPQAVRLLFPCPSKLGGGGGGDIPSRRQSRCLRAHWLFLSLDSLRILGTRPPIQLKGAPSCR